jgi:protein-tyrosine phosphatase
MQNKKPFQRILNAEKLYNLRDYGGYPTSYGGRLREGWLYRSGTVGTPTALDSALLKGLQLSVVIDLRSVRERDVAPTRLDADCAARVVFSESYTRAKAPHVRAATAAISVDMVRARLREAYEKMPYQPAMVDLFGRVPGNGVARR